MSLIQQGMFDMMTEVSRTPDLLLKEWSKGGTPAEGRTSVELVKLLPEVPPGATS